MRRFTTQTVVTCIAAVALAACATPEPPAPTPAPEQTPSDFTAKEPPPPAPAPAPAVSVDLATIYFDFDRSEIRDDARPMLRANADALGGNAVRVTIEGHCDERGNEEYNLALGERRANAVKRYLVNLGVSASRLRTLSYGEAKPASRGHDESAWRWNRRTEFRTSR